MTAWMPPPSDINPRKRQAPSQSTPIYQNPAMQNSAFASPQQMSNEDYMWQGAPDQKIPLPGMRNPNAFGHMAATPFNAPFANSPQYGHVMPSQSNQLARRPNQHLVQSGQKNQFHDPNEWALTDNTYFDPSHQAGAPAENESIDRLEERAAAAKRDAQSKRKQIPPFVQKLSSFLDDGKNTDLIRWSDRGDSFVVLDEDEFAKTLIPELFKHNNYASFVRQLNMYGFHKRVGLSDNSMKASERKNKSPSEYYNPYFKRGHPNLLWLINKPKNPQKKGKGRAKQEEGPEESEDENKDNIEEIYGYGQDPRSRAISTVPDGSGQAGPVALTQVQRQLRDIQVQQGNIQAMIARLREQNQDLYQRADQFSKLHNRHENSINAILTFLATLYNRSIDPNNSAGQDLNLMRVFSSLSNTMPQDQQHPQGNVVDLENMPQGQQNGNLSPMRRPPKMLMAPPVGFANQGLRSQSASAVSTPFAGVAQNSRHQSVTTPKPGAIEEVFDTSPGKSPEVSGSAANESQTTASSHRSSSTPGSNLQAPQENILDLINKTNAHAPRQKDMAFPDALHHFENANGNSPLSAQQRNDMLQLIASTAGSSSGGIQALGTPSPLPTPLNLEQLQYTQEELEHLQRLQAEQDSKIGQVSNLLGPLTPGGQIPGVDAGTGSYFANGIANGDVSPLGGANLDLDQFLDDGAYYNPDVEASSYANYDGFPNDAMAPALDFGGASDPLGMDGAMDTASPSGSKADTPQSVNLNDGTAQQSEGSPKRRRIG